MTGIETGLLTAAAALVAFWPKLAGVLKHIKVPTVTPKPETPDAVTYQAAMAALATVRSRLVATGGPSDASAKAITQITQDLVVGSDK